MKIQKRKVILEKEVTEYIAEDGTAFDNMNDCREYEEEWRNKLLDESPDVIECKEAKDDMPFDGCEYNEDISFRWFKPLNTNGTALINKLFSTDLDERYVDDWLCLELCDDAVYVSCLDSSVDYAKRMLETFGIDDELKFMRGFAKSADFDYDNNYELKTLRILWTAYCLHKNLDTDTSKYDSKLSEIWEVLSGKSPLIRDAGFEKFNRYMCKHLV